MACRFGAHLDFDKYGGSGPAPQPNKQWRLSVFLLASLYPETGFPQKDEHICATTRELNQKSSGGATGLVSGPGFLAWVLDSPSSISCWEPFGCNLLIKLSINSWS